MENLHLFLGPNSFAIWQERSRWIQAFREKHGEENFRFIQGKDVTFRELTDEVSVAPFIAEKRLVVVEGVPKGKKGEGDSFVNSIHPSVVVLFTLETDLGKKAKLTIVQKELAERALRKDFPQLSSSQINAWMDGVCKAEGTCLESRAAARLFEIVGGDQALLFQELKKLSLYAHGRSITADDVDRLVVCSMEREVWALVDMLGAQNVDGALRYVRSLLDRGMTPEALWGTFLWMIALIVRIRSLVDDGETNPWTIAGHVRAHGNSVRAVLPFVRSVDLDSLQRIVDTVLAADRDLKTGVLRSSAQDSVELLTLIDRSILRFA